MTLAIVAMSSRLLERASNEVTTSAMSPASGTLWVGATTVRAPVGEVDAEAVVNESGRGQGHLIPHAIMLPTQGANWTRSRL